MRHDASRVAGRDLVAVDQRRQEDQRLTAATQSERPLDHVDVQRRFDRLADPVVAASDQRRGPPPLGAQGQDDVRTGKVVAEVARGDGGEWDWARQRECQ